MSLSLSSGRLSVSREEVFSKASVRCIIIIIIIIYYSELFWSGELKLFIAIALRGWKRRKSDIRFVAPTDYYYLSPSYVCVVKVRCSLIVIDGERETHSCYYVRDRFSFLCGL